MAHFARVSSDGVVLDVVVIHNDDCCTEGGIERESIGVAYCEELYGEDTCTWKQCSYNTREGVHYCGYDELPECCGDVDDHTPLRANYPSPGWLYSAEHDIFHKPRPEDRYNRPCDSWTLNTTTGVWEPPVAKPEVVDDGGDNAFYVWDEPTQTWINIYAE